MAGEGPLRGQERIGKEPVLQLGIQVSPRTVSKHMSKRAPGQPRGDRRWSIVLKHHATAIPACDVVAAVAASFRIFHQQYPPATAPAGAQLPGGNPWRSASRKQTPGDGFVPCPRE